MLRTGLLSTKLEPNLKVKSMKHKAFFTKKDNKFKTKVKIKYMQTIHLAV